MSTSFIPLSDPHVTAAEVKAVSEVLGSPRLSAGPAAEAFEKAFAVYCGRKYAIAVSSGTMGMLLVLKAHGIGPGDEVIASAYSWRETAHAIALAGAVPVFADIDYWAGTLVPEKAEARITDKTRAIIACNNNGHPAPWSLFRELAIKHGLILIEDSTEAIGSVYKGARVGSFGDCAVFDFSQPGPITCGEGGMIVTDDETVARAIRRLCSHLPQERASVVVAAAAPYQAAMSDLSAALGLAQLNRIDAILALRKVVEGLYFKYIKSFEGIKDPYIAPDVEEVHWFLYTVHLGTRFSKSSRDAIVEDLKTEGIEAAAYSHPLHLQRHYFDLGHRRGDLFVTGKVAERAIALPFHPHLTETQIAFIVGTMKDASINVGAGAAIYL
jgi:perosamine synthetase